MADFGKVCAAFLGGVIAGGVAALLLAPKTGEEMRAQIKAIALEKGAKLNKEELEVLYRKVIARVKDWFNDAEIEAAVEEGISEVKA
ncbi:MAG: YtxH domain-containing protein [Paludibacteraceae bacterium]|nr:YtxH domain-containing protein [Paludibacteraceae bacterium]